MERFCKTCDKSIHNKPKRSLFCSLKCYHTSLVGKTPKNINLIIDLAARKKRGVGVRTIENADEWFWTKVEKKDNGCWVWTGAKSFYGYGVLSWGKIQSYGAHRMSFWIANKKEPKLFILHSCDNKCCVNPDHLREGSHVENMQDAIDRNRFLRGEDSKSSKLTKKQVFQIMNSNKMNIEIAKEFNISNSTVSRIKNKKIWKHL